VNIETTHTPYLIDAYEPMTLNWYARESEGDEWVAVGTTQHSVYVTFDWPTGSEPTKKRLNWVCEKARRMSILNGGAIVDAIHQALKGDPPNDGTGLEGPNGKTRDWRLLIPDEVPDPWHPGQTIFRYAGECNDQTHLMNLALQMLGITSGWEYLTRASRDAFVVNDLETTTAAQLGYTVDLDGNGVVGDETFELIFDFPSSIPGHHWNDFEGSIQAPGGYYAVWPSLNADSAFDLYCQITNQVPRPNQLSAPKAKQYWVMKNSTTVFYPTEVPRAPGCP